MALNLASLLALIVLQGPTGSGLVPLKLKPAPGPNQVLAKVNGQAIRASDVAPLLWEWRGQEAIQDTISYLMAAQEAAKKGIVVSEAEAAKAVEAERQALAKSMGVDIKRVDAVLLEQGFTRSRLYLRVKSRLMIDRLAERGFEAQEFISVSTLVFKPASEQTAALTAAIAAAEAAYAQLQTGEAWDTVLAATTKEPAMLKTKGALGWKELSAFPASVLSEMKALKVGQFTKPAQTTNGIQVFRLDARGSDAKGAELQSLKAAYLVNARQATVERLRATTKIERFWK